MKLKSKLKIRITFSCLVCICLLTVFLASGRTVRGVGTNTQSGIVVVVDAGHGGRDGGVIGKTTGTKEADINLAIARELESILVNNNYIVVMTRTNQDGLYGDATTNRKQKDMRERQRIIQEAKPNLVVSIHQNAFPRHAERGAQVFYSVGADKNGVSFCVASAVQKQLNSQLPECDRVTKKGDFYIINKTEYPSILVECGFLTTPADEQALVTKEYQNKVAKAIFEGIEHAKSSCPL